jgi:hypothetical protein
LNTSGEKILKIENQFRESMLEDEINWLGFPHEATALAEQHQKPKTHHGGGETRRKPKSKKTGR